VWRGNSNEKVHRGICDNRATLHMPKVWRRHRGAWRAPNRLRSSRTKGRPRKPIGSHYIEKVIQRRRADRTQMVRPSRIMIRLRSVAYEWSVDTLPGTGPPKPSIHTSPPAHSKQRVFPWSVPSSNPTVAHDPAQARTGFPPPQCVQVQLKAAPRISAGLSSRVLRQAPTYEQPSSTQGARQCNSLLRPIAARRTVRPI
jgi:hypothetical protein